MRHIIIVGCGRVGAPLAERLSAGGDDVVIIDRNESTLQNLGVEFRGRAVAADPIDLEVLRRAGIDSADVFIAATNSDNVNLLVAHVARTSFCVEHVIARTNSPESEPIYQTLGIETVNPSQLTAERLAREAGSRPVYEGMASMDR